jgi:FAD synthase
VHLLGGAIPDGALKVEFLRFLRPEREFASVGELRNQIALDVRQAGADVV